MNDVRFGSYRVVETLGSGSLSSIYKAVQEPIGRVVAIKALKAEMAPTSSFGEQLEREAKVLSDLAHPNVVLVLDVARTPAGRPYVVLEHVDGPSLDALLKKKRKVAVEAALAIACGMCAALEHAHERGVVHRDVKPSNVLLAKSGVVKMIDFGIAQRARTASVSDAEGITPSGRMAPEPIKDAYGTPAYMSPEQILGDFVDGRSDLFSLGVVLYQMTSGSRPFESDRGAAQRSRRGAAAPLRDRAPDVPRSVERIVMRLLEKAPADRHPTASALRERLEGALRAITREDKGAIVRAALVDAGFVERPRKPSLASDGADLDDAPKAGIARQKTMAVALAGHAAVLAVFVVGAASIEGGSCSARAAGKASGAALELAPDRAGGLRVVATPWAHVKIDGQDVDTTPFARAIPLAPGKHWVTLTHPDSPPLEREILVVPGETVTLDVTMPSFLLEDAGPK